MVAIVNWSPEAVEDLDSIIVYISKDSYFYAKAVADKILAVTKEIPEYPYLGRVVPEIGDEQIRERFVYSYRLIYKANDDITLIIAIVHGSRLLENLEGRF
jgi:toxin ParE1/3/4